jgi:hypothetical protein
MQGKVQARLFVVAGENIFEQLHGHAVVVHLKLSDGDMGTQEDDGPIEDLTCRIERIVEATGAGEFDGDEWGGGYCKLFIYGPDADSIAKIVLPDLLGYPARPGSYLVKRYGAPGSNEALIELGSRCCSSPM